MSAMPNQSLPEGARLGVYEIKKTIKADSLAIFYQAWNHHLKEQVEIQEYFPHDFAVRAANGLTVECKSARDTDHYHFGLKAFLAQSERLSQIEHPNCVKAETILPFNQTAYLVSACPEGTPLSQRVKSSAPLTEAELTLILTSTLKVLQTLHDHQIVHGNLQPTTILLSANGEPVLTEFANARWVLAAHANKFPNELASCFVAPELYDPASEPKPASDFYALGATLYYCLTQEQPASALSRTMALSKGKPDPLKRLRESQNETFNATLPEIIHWMLQTDTQQRPQSAAQILARLQPSAPDNPSGQKAASSNGSASGKLTFLRKHPLIVYGTPVIAGLAIIAGLWLNQAEFEPKVDASRPLLPDSAPSAPLIQAEGARAVPTNQQPAPATEPTPASAETNAALLLAQNTTTSAATPNPTNLASAQTQKSAELPVQSPEKSPSTVTVESKAASDPLSDPTKVTDQAEIKRYLTAAQKAMKRVQLTTPASDNAHHYYRKVLEIDPENAEAQAGLQKIVDRYIWFLQKAKADGKINTAKRTLLRAESVLPNDPKLHKIRTELFAPEN
jgi:serine/threonine protein kinase